MSATWIDFISVKMVLAVVGKIFDSVDDLDARVLRHLVDGSLKLLLAYAGLALFASPVELDVRAVAGKAFVDKQANLTDLQETLFIHRGLLAPAVQQEHITEIFGPFGIQGETVSCRLWRR